jgi:hypothetical protein
MEDKRTAVVLSPEVYVAATMIADGPPAALFNALMSRRDDMVIALSSWLLDSIRTGMVASGYTADQAKGQTDFISQLGVALDPPSGGDPLAALARAAGLDEAFCAGRPTGTTVDGVRMAPIHELMTRLGIG